MAKSFLPDLIAKNLQRIDAPECPLYLGIIEHCFHDPPPYVRHWFGRRYFELARNAEWFANSLVSNATLEGYGATQIWAFSNRVGDDAYSEAIRRHALDESRHSTTFVRMLSLVFPGLALDKDTKAALEALQPRFTEHHHPPTFKCPKDELLVGDAALDELIQVHITEIRALILQFLLRSALMAHAPSSNHKPLMRMSDWLIRDEAHHIRYTAQIFEAAARAGRHEFLYSAFEHRSTEFNELTMIEFDRENITA